MLNTAQHNKALLKASKLTLFFEIFLWFYKF